MENRKRITLYVTDSQHAEIKALCARLGISMNWFIHKSIRDRIKKELSKLK